MQRIVDSLASCLSLKRITPGSVESMPGIIRGTSLFDLDVPVSVYPALDILNLRFCSYEHIGDRIDE
jgi:hypothetical protein